MNAPALATTQINAALPTTFSLVPQTLTEAMELAKLIADSDLAPKDYRSKPGNVMIAVQMGQEVGLSPMTAIQSIAVINGKPGLYGDVGKAILLSRGFIIEEDDVEIVKKNGKGRCKITRPGHPPCERTFSIENAKTANLWGKAGPWTQYPERQLAWRAFWFAARDIASDVLKGLQGREELVDIPERDVTAQASHTIIKTVAQPWSAEEFEVNFPKWAAVIERGRKTVDDVIATATTKHAFTEEQEARLRAVKVVEPTGNGMATLGQIEEILAKAAAATITESEIFKRFGISTLANIQASMAVEILAFIANPS